MSGSKIDFSVNSKNGPKALPGFDLINQGVKGLKGCLNNGQGMSFGKVGAYLGYRLLSYSGLPTALNAISAVLSLALAILTIPLRCCDAGKKLNNNCLTRLVGSVVMTGSSLYDLTTDVRMLLGGCCCTQTLYGRV